MTTLLMLPGLPGLCDETVWFAQRPALAGHSMGGRVALEIARIAPKRVER